ncbi:redox-regulated ATPase YchF [Buchnera aphidicola]|uniref:redox-regulated ATPase YchF n=1 Tax=Buchnera aphidicola TaxID=9 RepID=UPI002238BEC5|nr:redox-regulated ATPase YchF [Buchnera aphidicola]MCW5197731.1 redox-regulated ATPase YchF [Buchnera aphidicola (Chaitophorus viminalis)]
MNVKCGIIGLPNVGKSTIFNILTKSKASSLNFPFCTISPNIGFSQVYDHRLISLKNIINPKKLVSTVVKIVDIAGLVKGASKGEGLGNKFLNQIREVDALIHVVRAFKDDNIMHVENFVDPIRDIKIINTELIFSDIEICEKNILIQKKNKNLNKNISEEYLLLKKCLLHLNKFYLLQTLDLSFKEKILINKFKFLTLKPTIFLINIHKNDYNNIFLDEVKSFLKKDLNHIIYPEIIKNNNNYKNLDNFTELNEIITTIYKILNLKTFFTVGKKEVRAWSFIKHSKIVKVAKVIHSDFKKGFIRAKVISYIDFIKYKSEKKVQQAGKLRFEGKKYIVQDGDIIHFLFNV